MWLPALFLAAMTGITGCGAAGDGGAHFPTAPRGWQPTRADLGTLDRAESVLAGRCMVAHGFRYPLGRPVTAPPDFRYVIDDPSWAKVNGFGYDLDKAAEHDRAHGPLATYASGLAPARLKAFNVALNGPEQNLGEKLPQGGVVRQSSHGCQAQAEGDLYGNMIRWFGANSLAENLNPIAETRVRTDRRFTAATHAWSRCMHAAGITAAAPDALYDRLYHSHDRARIRDAAVKEATCAVSTGLGPLARRLHAAYLAKQQARFHRSVAAQRGMQYAALPRARRLAASS